MLGRVASCTVHREHTWKTARTNRPVVGFRTVPWLDFAPIRVGSHDCHAQSGSSLFHEKGKAGVLPVR